MKNIELIGDEDVQRFVGEFRAINPLLTLKDRLLTGALALQDTYMEF